MWRPRLAALLALPFKAPAGRVLSEALAGVTSDNRVEVTTQYSAPIKLARTCSPDDPGCERPLGPVSYRVMLLKKTVTVAETKQSYSYLDRASVTRERRASAAQKVTLLGRVALFRSVSPGRAAIDPRTVSAKWASLGRGSTRPRR